MRLEVETGGVRSKTIKIALTSESPATYSSISMWGAGPVPLEQ